MPLIRSNQPLKEGEVFNKWLRSRLIKNNKNVLTATTGSTGSSKSYQDLRRAELWYKLYFNKEFPSENICFSVAEVMRRLSTPKPKKGEIIIFEEAGTNLGSLDFQNKVSKLFTYVLQTFRTLNVAIFFNLPYLSMLNKSARLLIHVRFETCGIDFEKKIAKSKAWFRQVNQSSGKVYEKFLRIRHNGRIQVIKKFNYHLPSEELRKVYEKKKLKFITDMNTDFVKELDIIERDKLRKLMRPSLTNIQMETYELLVKYKGDINKVAEDRGRTVRTIQRIIKSMKKRGYDLKFKENA